MSINEGDCGSNNFNIRYDDLRGIDFRETSSAKISESFFVLLPI